MHKRGNWDQTGPQLSLKLANIATRHPGGPSPPCTTQKLWCQGAGSEAIKTAGGLAEGNGLGVKKQRVEVEQVPPQGEMANN